MRKDDTFIRQIKDPLKRGDEFIYIKEYAKAVDCYLEALMKDTGDISINMKLGETYIKMNNYIEARQTFEEVLRINPESTIAQNYLNKINSNETVYKGDSYYKRKEYKKAITCYNNVLQINPEHVSALHGLARIYEIHEKHDKALEIYEKISEINDLYQDEYKYLLNHIAISLRKGKRYEKAISVYCKAISIDPNDEALYFNLAGAYWATGKREMAVQELKKALNKDPDFPEAIDLLKTYEAIIAQ